MTTQLEYSPFTPGQPVSPELFVGRSDEIVRLDFQVKAAIAGRLQVAFLSGERGMGKSSLAAFVKLYAERQHGMVGVHTFLGGTTSLHEMVRRTFDRVLNESSDKKWYDAIANLFGKTVKQVGMFGINLSFAPSEVELDAIVRNFPRAMREIVGRLKGKGHSGLMLILDDLNGMAASPEFASWLKSTLDEIAVSGGMSLCVFLVGLEERRQDLIASQPSLARAFELFPMNPWTSDETHEFFVKAFEQAGIKIVTDALEVMVSYTGGLPTFAHEIGDAVVRADQDRYIDVADVTRGLVCAADIIGMKYLEPQVLKAVRSQNYRSILRKLVLSLAVGKIGGEIDFERAVMKNILDEEENRNVDNFLMRMKDLGIIVPEPERGPGAYRFASRLHHLYLRLDAERTG